MAVQVIYRVLLGIVLALALISDGASQAPALDPSSTGAANITAAPVQQTPATSQKAAADAPMAKPSAVQQQAPVAAGPATATLAPGQAVDSGTATTSAAADSNSQQQGSIRGSATPAAATVSQVVLVAPAAVADQSKDINPAGELQQVTIATGLPKQLLYSLLPLECSMLRMYYAACAA